MYAGCMIFRREIIATPPSMPPGELSELNIFEPGKAGLGLRHSDFRFSLARQFGGGFLRAEGGRRAGGSFPCWLSACGRPGNSLYRDVILRPITGRFISTKQKNWSLTFLLAQSVLNARKILTADDPSVRCRNTSRSSVVLAGSSRYTTNSQPYDATETRVNFLCLLVLSSIVKRQQRYTRLFSHLHIRMWKVDGTKTEELFL